MSLKKSINKAAALMMFAAAMNADQRADFDRVGMPSRPKKFKKRPNTPKGITKKKKAKRRIVSQSRRANRKL